MLLPEPRRCGRDHRRRAATDFLHLERTLGNIVTTEAERPVDARKPVALPPSLKGRGRGWVGMGRARR